MYNMNSDTILDSIGKCFLDKPDYDTNSVYKDVAEANSMIIYRDISAACHLMYRLSFF